MNSAEIKEKYPRVIALITDWLDRRINNKVDDLPDGFVSTFLTDAMINSIFENSPHSLFEFFDEREFYIIIEPRVSPVFKMEFKYSIFWKNKGRAEVKSGDFEFINRKDAERAAITDAVILLDNRLNE